MSRILAVLYSPIDIDMKAIAERAAAGRAEVRIIDPRDAATIPADAEALIGDVRPKHISLCPNVKWVQTSFAGVERIVPEVKKIPGAVLTNASGAFGEGISEYLLMYILMLQNRARDYIASQDKREWRPLGVSPMLAGSTVAVLGLGDLGGVFARKIKALGASVRGVKRTAGAKPDYVDELYTTDELDKALDGADIVALCLPDTAATEKILSRERIFALKQGAIIVNAGRGGAIDQPALTDALKQNRVLAGLDVTTPEPLPSDDPLWTAPNVIITPHISGLGASAYATRFSAALFERN
ncbi:MAG: D-2-hydroxyacid dehydrogenase, partial [Oscillospiraceae bacterium]|nr:D-2-hydroxyacid dehydrogenase [Oscillospiraceae bacterium]